MTDSNKESLSIKANKISFTASQKDQGSTEGQWNFAFKATPGKVAIVYPSLCSPLVKASGDPLNLYILVDQAFHDTYLFSKAIARQIVAVYLKFEKWKPYRALQDKVKPSQRPAPQDEPLCANRDSVQRDIALDFIGELGATEGKIPNQDKALFAILHPNACEWYQGRGLNYLYRVTIAAGNAQIEKAKDQELWALSWRVPNAENDSLFEQFQDQLIQEYSKNYVNKEQECAAAYKISSELSFEEDLATPLQSHHPVYIYDGDKLNLGQLTDVHVSSRQHIFDRGKPRVVEGVSEIIGEHVNKAYTPLKNLMDHFGQDADTHLLVFTGDLVDYGRNFDPASEVGKKIESSAGVWAVLNLDHIDDEALYPRHIDLRIMYSLFMYYYDTHGKPILLVSGNHEGYTLPYGISPRLRKKQVFGGLVSGKWSKTTARLKRGWNSIAFWNDDPDPHELRDLEEFIKSESKGRKEFVEDTEEADIQDATRANEGIPADHNLTIYEACLLYGPDYDRVLMAGNVESATNTNFNAENYRWLYILFTPITDIWFKIGQQVIIGLNWGEGEQMIRPIDGPTKNSEVRAALEKEGRHGFKWNAVGILPQSTESLSDNQVDIIRAALEQKQACNILCAHFTIANYDPSMSYEIADDDGNFVPRQAPVSVGGATSRQVTTHFNTGTFQENRSYLMQDCIQQGKIHLTLSGHSHRAGLYQDIGTSPTFSQSLLGWAGAGDDMVVQPHAPQADGRYQYQYQPDKCLFLVSASGGSMPVQNYRGEMIGCGMAPPSGSSVKFNGGQPEIKVVEYSKGSSQPRFCVAMDFMDVLGPESTTDKEGVFERVECIEDISPLSQQLEIYIQLNQRRFPDVKVLSGGKLHIFLDETKKFVSLPFDIGFEHSHLHKAVVRNEFIESVNDRSFNVLQIAQKNAGAHYFLELQFDSSGLANNVGYRQYDFDSAWYIQMSLQPRELLEKTARGVRRTKLSGFRFERDADFGEVPSFKWRAANFENEYKLSSKYSG